MTWWMWVLIWVAAVALALFWYVRIGLRLWRSARDLLSEVGRAAEGLSALDALSAPAGRSASGGRTGDSTDGDPTDTLAARLAVFADPAKVARERQAAAAFRTRQRARRRAQV